MTISVELKDLSIEKTIFQNLKEKQKVKEYLDWLKGEYSKTKVEIEGMWDDPNTKTEWEGYSDETDVDTWLIFIRRFTSDESITENIKEGANEKIANLFASNASDSEVKKDLKTQPTDELLGSFSFYSGDKIAYAVELCKNFYLEWLSECVEENLKGRNLTLNDLDKKEWNELRAEIFTDLYSSWEETTDENEINKLKKKLEEDVAKLSGIKKKAPQITVDDLKDAKEKYKKEDINGKPWDLTDQEKAKIDQTTDIPGLKKVVREIKDERDNSEKGNVNGWIKKNISDKTKKEDLPSEADIDNNPDIPANFKEYAKQALQKKIIELMPETTSEGKIKKHLLKALYDWKHWGDIIDNAKKDDNDYFTALSFGDSFRKSVAEGMKSKIEEAIKTDTIEGYKKLDKEWGEDKLDEKNEAIYNVNRDFLGDWNTLRGYLKELETNEGNSKYENMKKFMITNHYKEERWAEIEVLAEIDKKN